MLRGIIREILSGQHDMQIVGETQTDNELMSVLASNSADVAVMELDVTSEFAAGAVVQQSQLGACVLGLSTNGRTASMYEVRIRRTTIVEVSPEGLRESIRRHSQYAPELEGLPRE